MFTRSISLATFASMLFVGLSACSSPDARSAAPDLADDDLQTMQSVPWGTATITSATPAGTNGPLAYDTSDDQVQGSVSWTGSGTYATGACLLVKVYNTYQDANWNWVSDPVPCTSASQCSTYQVYTGGNAYCKTPNNDAGQKYCYVRPGSQANFCVGTPADGKQVTVPATKTTGWKSAYAYYTNFSQAWISTGGQDGYWDTAYNEAHWIMDGCFNGCSGAGGAPTTGSDSSERVFWSNSSQEGMTIIN